MENFLYLNTFWHNALKLYNTESSEFINTGDTYGPIIKGIVLPATIS